MLPWTILSQLWQVWGVLRWALLIVLVGAIACAEVRHWQLRHHNQRKHTNRSLLLCVTGVVVLIACTLATLFAAVLVTARVMFAGRPVLAAIAVLLWALPAGAVAFLTISNFSVITAGGAPLYIDAGERPPVRFRAVDVLIAWTIPSAIVGVLYLIVWALAAVIAGAIN